MHALKMATLALLMALHTIAGTGEDNSTPHVLEDAIEAIETKHTHKHTEAE